MRFELDIHRRAGRIRQPVRLLRHAEERKSSIGRASLNLLAAFEATAICA